MAILCKLIDIKHDFKNVSQTHSNKKERRVLKATQRLHHLLVFAELIYLTKSRLFPLSST